MSDLDCLDVVSENHRGSQITLVNRFFLVDSPTGNKQIGEVSDLDFLVIVRKK